MKNCEVQEAKEMTSEGAEIMTLIVIRVRVNQEPKLIALRRSTRSRVRGVVAE